MYKRSQQQNSLEININASYLQILIEITVFPDDGQEVITFVGFREVMLLTGKSSMLQSAILFVCVLSFLGRNSMKLGRIGHYPGVSVIRGLVTNIMMTSKSKTIVKNCIF